MRFTPNRSAAGRCLRSQLGPAQLLKTLQINGAWARIKASIAPQREAEGTRKRTAVGEGPQNMDVEDAINEEALAHTFKLINGAHTNMEHDLAQWRVDAERHALA